MVADELHVVLLAPSDGGGMLHYCSQLANALAERVKVSVIVDDGADKSLFGKSVNVENLNFPGYVSELGPSLLRLWFNLYKRLSDASVDVVHATILNPIIVPPLIALRSKKTVFTLHDPANHLGGEKVSYELARWLIVRGVDRIVVHGEYNLEQSTRRFGFGDKFLQITHGDYSFFSDYCDAAIKYDPELLFFGRIRPYKGLDTLFEADKYLCEQASDYRLTIAGGGPIDGFGQNAGEHVTIINRYISNEIVCELFSRCRAVVLPYREASQTGIIPIAYSFRKPVIATNVGGIPESVEDGRTGLLIEPDDPKALSNACLELLSDTEKAKTMGEHAFNYQSEHMSWTKIADALIMSYEDIG